MAASQKSIWDDVRRVAVITAGPTCSLFIPHDQSEPDHGHRTDQEHGHPEPGPERSQNDVAEQCEQRRQDPEAREHAERDGRAVLIH